MSYFYFLNKIENTQIKTIFELGSRDLIDAIKLLNHYDDCTVYAFECNEDCLVECKKNYSNLEENKKNRLFLVDKAVSIENGNVYFYPFDLKKYNNMGASSMLKIDFSTRNKDDPDYNLENPQKEIIVNGTRLDSFIDERKIKNIDLLCIDLQGYELNALKSLGSYLHKVKYIITECSIMSTYTNGATFKELNDYLVKFNFKYVLSNNFGENYPDLSIIGFSEFDALFINMAEEKEISSEGTEEKEISSEGTEEKEISLEGTKETEISSEGTEEKEISLEGTEEKEISFEGTEETEISFEGTEETI